MSIIKESAGTIKGRKLSRYIVTNINGMELRILDFGAVISHLFLPDIKGPSTDIVLGYDNAEDYCDNPAYLGCIVGRYANRIAEGRFELNGRKYNLSQNNGTNALHGGISGFSKKFWRSESFETKNGSGVNLEYLSVDGEEGYPGNLRLKVIYTLTDSNEIRISYHAETDQDTVINLSNHSYFNLAGEGSGDICSHILKLNAERFTPTSDTMIPTGVIASVKDSPLDFTEPEKIGKRIAEDCPQLRTANGYDFNYVINSSADELAFTAEVMEPISGRRMRVYTTEPGVQFYTGNFLDGVKGKNGHIYESRHGFCLETQHYPDSPNIAGFPSTVLKAGEEFQSETVYKFFS